MSDWFSRPEAPTPPNPMQTAAAQTGTNVSTAIANSYLGNVNQVTPTGFLNNQVTGNFTYTDPTTNQTFNIPRWTSTQSIFNPTEYLKNNPDVMAAARNSGWSPDQYDQFAINHFNQYGRIEGRSPGVAGETANQQDATKYNLAQMSNQQSGMLRDMLGQPFDANFNASQYLWDNPDVRAAARQYSPNDMNSFARQHWQDFGQNEGRASGMPSAGDINLFNSVQGPQSTIADTPGMQYGYGSGGGIQYGFGDAGDITRTYGPQDNYGADRSRIEAGLLERMNPQLQIEQDRLRNQLANQGIAYGSTAYTNAMDNYNRMANDARLGVINIGGQEQQRMDQMAAQRAGFQNSAQQQAYAQLLGRGQFYNQAQQQAEGQAAARGAFYNQAAQSAFDQAAARGQFYNQAQNQALGLASSKFNAANTARNQALQEAYQQRSQPINEITALLSGSQVSSPNFINAQRASIPTTDVAGLINQNFAQQNDLYKTGMTSWNDLLGGIIGGGSKIGASILSDEREKEDIKPLGSVFSVKGELPIYEYQYKKDPDERRHVGPMAQDVERLEPKAVRTIGGRKHILPDKLGSIFGRAA